MVKKRTGESHPLVPQEYIESRILFIRGKKVLLDRDLAGLYKVITGNLNKAVKRNIERFLEDFMFQLTEDETEALRFHFGILKQGCHFKYRPYVFTQEGVAMLSSVLKSERAVFVNIQIMRVFVKLRELMISHKDLAHKIEDLERKYKEHDKNFVIVFEAIKKLLTPPTTPKRRIGFHP